MLRALFLAWAMVLAVGLTPIAEAAAPGASTSGPTNLTLTPSQPSALVGQTVTWTATAQDTVPIEYRFSVELGTNPVQVVRDYESGNSFTWTPILEGSWTIQVSVQEVGTSNVASLTSQPFAVQTRITNGKPVVTPTNHPLVFLYSVPPCGKGAVNVVFGFGSNSANYTTTPVYPCSSKASSNFYLGGLLPQTQYSAFYTVRTGTKVTHSAVTKFTTGAIPSGVTFPLITEPVPASSSTAMTDSIVFYDTVGAVTQPTDPHMFATNLSGAVVWYYPDTTSDPAHQYIDHPLPGGQVAAVLDDSQGNNELFRVSDLAGNPLLETSTGRLNEQLGQLMTTPPAPGTSCGKGAAGQTICFITQATHEFNKLPNGHYITMGYVEQLMPAGTQGSTTGLPVDILTDQVIDLNSNLQVDWTANMFDLLPITRTAILGETCGPNSPGCPTTLQYASQAGGTANDWTHDNAAVYSASDHNLLISVRHQDWILKLNYQDAAGDGSLIWKLGNQGDFTLTNPPAGDSFPWFSHQHGIENLGSNDPILTFDDGNTRCFGAPAGTCDSRGQGYNLDEVNKTATLYVDASMGNYSSALGWAQTLANGDYAFTSGFQGVPPGLTGELEEFDSTGTTETYAIQINPDGLYRGYRMTSMYQGCCGD
jgi:hypothetical protein